MTTILTNYMTDQISNAIADGLSAVVWLLVIGIIISLAVFSLFVAVGTYVVKRVWFSDWGGNPRRYR